MSLFSPHKCGNENHNYEPRYDLTDTPGIKERYQGNIWPDDLVKIITATKNKIYIHDICTYCGDIKKR